MNSLTFYQRLDQIPFLKTMALKVAFVAFIGIHIPLILSVVVLLGLQSELGPGMTVFYLLLFTLLATGLTLFFLNKVVQPIRFLSEKLRAYISEHRWNETPVTWRDENGCLSRDLDACIQTLERTVHEKNDLYRLLSHDLKGMLATLQAGLMMLEMDVAQNMRDEIIIKDKIELIERQILNVNSLLYYYSESGMENYKIDIAPVKVQPMINEVVALYNSALKIENKTIQIDIPAEYTVTTGRFLLRHLIFNLVDNAVKYSQKGSEIHVSMDGDILRVSNTKGKQMVFGVNDWKKSTGLGQKIISKTAQDLGFALNMNGGDEETYSVALELLPRLQAAS